MVSYLKILLKIGLVSVLLSALVEKFFVSRVRDFFDINHTTSSNLNLSYYPHRSRPLVSPVCGIFFIQSCQYGEVEKMKRIKAHFPEKKLKEWVNCRDQQVY